jgi:dynein heavy chain
MTPDIMDAIDSIADSRAPNKWIYDASGAEISWILPALGAWVSSLVERYN